MKDVMITGARILKELEILAMCFVIAVALNAFAIFRYKTDWIELLTMIHVEIALTLLLYFVSMIGRGVSCCGKIVVGKLKRS